MKPLCELLLLPGLAVPAVAAWNKDKRGTRTEKALVVAGTIPVPAS
jgi:hypothetical protein